MSSSLGAKLRREREALGLSQAALAKAVGLSSVFISNLEWGKRRPSLESLTALASFFKKEISYLLEEKQESLDALFRGQGIEEKARRSLKKFVSYCQEYLHLEDLTGRRTELAPLYTNVSAERMADEERRRLGLGTEPVKDVFTLLELNGLHFLRMPFPEDSHISGAFIFFEAKGAAFAVVNSAQIPELRAFTAAHQYCHYLKDRDAAPIIDNPDILIDEYLSLYHPREKFAYRFAVRFLVPPSKMVEVIDKDLGTKKLNLAGILYLKDYFGVSILAIFQTLKDLGYLSPSKIQEYRKLGLSADEDIFVREPQAKRQVKKETILSSRFKSLAVEAYQRKKVSVEKLSQLLNLKEERIEPFLNAVKNAG